jgi:hypothetical protein
MYSANPIKFVAKLPQQDVDECVRGMERQDAAGCCGRVEDAAAEDSSEPVADAKTSKPRKSRKT